MNRVLLFNGSPHPQGNTAIALGLVGAELERAGVETEYIQVGGRLLRGCTGCRRCAEYQNRRCIWTDDPVNDWIAKMAAADGFLIGSPVYTANVTAETKAFLDRTGFVAKANGFLFQGKPGAPVVVGTKAGMLPAYSAIQAMLAINQMLTVGSIHWNLAVGKHPGDILSDTEGVETLQTLGRNMAKLLERLDPLSADRN